MVIYSNGNIRYVICKIFEEENKVSYFTIGEDNDIYFYYDNEMGKFREYGTMIRKNLQVGKEQTEIEYITETVCYEIWFENFASAKEKEASIQLQNRVIEEFNVHLKGEIKKNLYSYYIKENELDLWKNSFEDRIAKISDNEFYIDDKDYDIFYKIMSDGEYEFEFLDK